MCTYIPVSPTLVTITPNTQVIRHTSQVIRRKSKVASHKSELKIALQCFQGICAMEAGKSGFEMSIIPCR